MAGWDLYAQVGKTAYDTTYAGISTIGQYSVNRITARMNAAAYRSQARMALLQAEQQSGYINEEAAQNVWNIAARASSLRGTQKAAMGASGFDVSTGDKRIIDDTTYRANEAAAGVNRTAYLQAFETQKQAALEASRLEYAAKAQEAIAKRSSPFKAFIASNFAALGAFAGNVGDLGKAGAFGNVKGTDISNVKK